ncbi:hypothetical protein P879_04329, partial [Paragonimus westermani]
TVPKLFYAPPRFLSVTRSNFEHRFRLSAESVELQDQNWAHLVDAADSVLWSTHFSKALDEAHCWSSHHHQISGTELANVLCDSPKSEAASKAVNELVVPVRLLDCPMYRVQLAGHRFFVRTFSMPAIRELSTLKGGTWSHLSLDVDVHEATDRSPILVHYHTLIKECDNKETDNDSHHVVQSANSSASPSDVPASRSVQPERRRSSLVKINSPPVMTSSPISTIALGHDQINPSLSSTIIYPTPSVIPRSPVSSTDGSFPIERNRPSQSIDSIFDNVNPTITYHHHHWPLKTHPSPLKSTCKPALSVGPFEKLSMLIPLTAQQNHQSELCHLSQAKRPHSPPDPLTNLLISLTVQPRCPPPKRGSQRVNKNMESGEFLVYASGHKTV